MPDPNLPTRSAFLPALLVLFVGSGCAALIYEVVWFQLLQLVIGSSAVSLGALLGTFMGGMCLGSLLLPRLVGPGRHPLRVYALLELMIGLAGLVVLFALPPAGRLYGMSIGHGQSTVLVRGALCALFLGVPTVCMGATLPAIGRWVKATPSGVSWLGFFYGGNIAGAVAGSLLAGFYLLRVYDIAVATYVAVAINVAVALIAFILAKGSPYAANASASGGPDTTQRSSPDDDTLSANWTIYLAIALSGLTALAAEVIWTRLLSLLLGGTVYTFSLILAVFLGGLGLGSSFGSVLGRSDESDRPHAARMRARILLSVCQILLVGAIAWSAWLLNRSLPYWPIDPTLAARPADLLQLDLVRCVWALLPAAVLWGASFPLALAAVASPGSDAGRLVGRVYAANTVGAVVGALAFSLLFVGWIGTQQSQRILLVLCTASALLALAPAVWQSLGRTGRSPRSAAALGAVATALVALLIGASWWLAHGVPEISSDLVAYGRFAASQASSDFVLYKGEGQNASVAVTMSDSGVRNFHVSGKIEASSEPQDMRLQRMLGHLPALVHPAPRSVLIVGCGAGVTAGSFVAYDDKTIERIVICEIEPLIPQQIAPLFALENHALLKDKRVEVVYDDARHFMLTCREQFDVITSDPIHPWVKGAATLYTQEYFELCRQRLKPGGVITQWVPLYESSDAAVKSEIATFLRVFPHGSVWSNDIAGTGYDVVLLGHAQPLQIDVAKMQARLERPDHGLVAYSLDEVGFTSAMDLMLTYAGQGTDLAPWLADAQINRDRNLRLQYLAATALNTQRGGSIYAGMVKHRKFPANLLVVSGDDRERLEQAFTGKKP